MNFVKSLNQICKENISFAGGKGANLGELIKVPAPTLLGFVILTSGFQKFLQEAGIAASIKDISEKTDIKDDKLLEENSNFIRGLIISSKIPQKIETEILRAFQKLGKRYVAVRSSATAEDSKNNSWAGELRTYLNVGRKDLIENVKKCWASLYTPNALIYKISRGLKKKDVGIAVVVQEMIEPRAAGVCFTSNPVYDNKNQIVIEAVWGLGEMLVQGEAIPDTYIVEKSEVKDFQFLNMNIAKQEEKLAGCKAGIKRVPIPKSEQAKQKLSLRQIKELAKICFQIERHYNEPQDIEWALKNNKFYIIQSRPITTLGA